MVADTGAKIEGRRLDIYMPSATNARKFGIRPVKVKIVELGKGTEASARRSDAAVKTDVARDVHHNGVENAATQEDLSIGRRAGYVSEAELSDAMYPPRARR